MASVASDHLYANLTAKAIGPKVFHTRHWCSSSVANSSKMYQRRRYTRWEDNGDGDWRIPSFNSKIF